MKTLFFFRSGKTAGYGTIYCRITVNGIRCKAPFTTGLKIPKKHWDSVRQQIKGEQYHEENESLELIRSQLRHLFNQMMMTGKPITADLLKERYLKGDEKPIDLLGLYHELLQAKRENPLLAPRTVECYENRKKLIEQYLEETKQQTLPLEAVTEHFVDLFYKWLTTDRKYTHNYACKNLQTLKEAMKHGVRKGHIKYNAIQFYRLSFRYARDPIYLNQQELKKLETYEFPTKGLQNTADAFLLMCYTGFSYSCLKTFDYEKHTYTDDKGTWIYKRRMKTQNTAHLPLFEKAEKILNKYDRSLRVYSNTKLNAYLKEIADLLGIDKHLTSHVGRKTFAMLKLEEGLSYESIAFMLGHMDTRTTQKVYAKVNRNRLDRELGKFTTTRS